MNERVFLPHKKKKLTSFQIIILGFLGVILLGTVFLMLPVSTRAGTATPFSDALFTSTSAVCVTGLVMHDTATYWSFFGQVVILFLIQIGGLGVITVAASFAMISGKKISLMQRSTMQEAIAAPKVGGIVRLTNFMIRTTLAIELLGTIIMAPVFCRDFGVKGLWVALFHSVSAFCNAGFDLMGTTEAFSSLTGYASEPVVNLTIMSLIIIGGIGFLTWDDLRANRLHWQKYRMQSKVILCTTAVLLIVPAIYFFFFEFSALEPGKRILCSLFQSVTPRTAGFNTVDLTSLRESGQAIIILLMLIGGSPGSTAGGMKTTTVAVLFATALSTFRRKEDTHFLDGELRMEWSKTPPRLVFICCVVSLWRAGDQHGGGTSHAYLSVRNRLCGRHGWLIFGNHTRSWHIVQSDFDSAHVLRQSRGADIDFCRIVRHTKAGGKTPTGKDNGWIKEEAIR